MGEGLQNSFADLLTQTRKYFSFQKEVYGEEMILSQPDLMRTFTDTLPGGSLEGFRASIETCQKCALSKNRTHFVFGAGKINMKLHHSILIKFIIFKAVVNFSLSTALFMIHKAMVI